MTLDRCRSDDANLIWSGLKDCDLNHIGEETVSNPRQWSGDVGQIGRPFAAFARPRKRITWI